MRRAVVMARAMTTLCPTVVPLPNLPNRRSLRVGPVDTRVSDIPTEEIAQLPQFRQPSLRWEVVNTVEQCARAVGSLRSAIATGQCDICTDTNGRAVRALGFDTESRPNYIKGAKNNAVALVQLCTPTTAYLFRLCIMCNRAGEATRPPPDLMSLLADPEVLKVGVGVRDDVTSMRDRDPSFRDNGSFVDLRPLMTIRWPSLKRQGLRNATATLLGVRLAKARQMKNWEQQKLTHAMAAYAAHDAYVGLVLLRAVLGLLLVPTRPAVTMT